MNCDFTSFLTSRRWVSDNEKLCAMEPGLRLKRSSSPAGLEPAIDKSKGGSYLFDTARLEARRNLV